MSLQVFEDVAVCFTERELASLTLEQKDLYREVVLENFAHVAFLGKVPVCRSLLGSSG